MRALVVSLLVLGCGAPRLAVETPAPRARARPRVEADTRSVYERALDEEPVDHDEEPFGTALTQSEAVPLTSVWDRFCQALAAHDADAAAREVAPDSIGFWDDVRTSALAPDGAPIMQPSVRLLGIVARRTVGPRELRAMDGGALFASAVRDGWAVPEEMSSALRGRIARAWLTPETATLSYGHPWRDVIHLDRFAGQWRVRLSSLFSELDGEAVSAATRAGRTEDEHLALLANRIAARLHLRRAPP